MNRHPDLESSWIAQFPALGRLPLELLGLLRQHSSVVVLPAGSPVYSRGHAPHSYLLVLNGRVRVQQVSQAGHEIVLYRVRAGESCALTTACLLGYAQYPAEAIAETDLQAAAVPRPLFDDLMARSADFRRFVFTGFSERLTKLFHVINEVAFSRIEPRLADRLLELSRGAECLVVTQQQLATELGTAREVVSRALSEFQKRGWVAVRRGKIGIINRTALEQLSQHKL